MANWSTEEDRIVRIEGAQASLWDWQTSHRQPPVRERSGSEWAGQVSAHYRHFKTHPTGTNVYFNMTQSSLGRVARGIVFLGPDPPSSRDNAVWMAFYPEVANWRGSPFHTVIISNKALTCAIEGPDPSGSYRLAPSLANKWADLEAFILPIVKTLRARVTLPYSLDLPDPPSCHGYRLSFRSSQEAFEAARKGRNTFQYLGAALSFLAAFWSHRGSTRPMHLLARWLSGYLNIDFERTARLLSFPPVSPNAGPSVVRRGMTISVRSPYLRYLPIFLDSNVPVIVELEGNFEVYNEGMRKMPNWPMIGPLMQGAVPYVSEGECCEVCKARLAQLQDDVITQSDPMSLAVERDIEWLHHCVALNQSDAKLVDGQDVEKPWGPILCSTLRRFALYEWSGERGVSMRRPIDSSQFYLLIKAYGLTSRYVSLLHREIDFFPGIAEPQEPDLRLEQKQDPEANHDLELNLNPAQEAVASSGEEGEVIEPLSSTSAPAYYSDEEDEEPASSSSAPLAPTNNSDTWETLLRRRVGYTHGNLPVPTFPDPAHSTYPVDADKGIKNALRFIGLTPAAWMLKNVRRREVVVHLCRSSTP
ncbi:hypothetical protein FA13DRAFT_1799256 [Coprinellus micaceus]|uniref:Uncharacterized protein n=1 Tax=Coprinellus micaceus TaxID=71717 RepID=A0A4Y7SLA3_COPMI|nr:hypothetical protein FA13DRAFT_1799256 [Coprinellus micaceus]